MQLSLIDPEAFKDGFNLGEFLSGIANSVLDPKAQPAGPKPDTSTAAAVARVSLDKSRALLELFDKAVSEALFAHGEISKSVAVLQNTLAADQAKYQKALSSCSRHSDKAREALRQVEAHSNRVGQVGTRLGDRLQRADGLRSRALELVRLLEYLALFVHLPEGDSAFIEGLPWDDRKLAEAASIAHKLRALTAEVESAGERNRLAGAAAAAEDAAAARAAAGGAAASPAASGGGAAPTAGTSSPAERRELAPSLGSLEYGIQRLGQYCLWLENRVVNRFDQAVEDDNIRMMGECARIMAAFDREKAIIQRYISLLPVFQSSVDEMVWVREPPVAADDAVVSERLRPLSRLYGTLGDTVAVEAGRMSSIFPNVRTALQMLVAKVFEDRVLMALERLLEDTAEDAFSRSTSYSSGRPMDELHDINEQYDSDGSGRYSRHRRGGGGGGGGAGGMYSDGDDYYDSDAGDDTDSDDDSGGGGGVRGRRKSVAASKRRSPRRGGNPVPPPPPGYKGPPPPPPPPPPPVTRAAATGAAQSYVSGRVAPVVRAVQCSGQVVRRLQEHHAKAVFPALDSSASEISACAGGLGVGLRGVETAVLSVMQALVDMIVIQAEKVLMYEQKRSEFLPPDGHLDAALLDRPTDACLLVCALFEALGKVARENLDGSNLASFLLEVGLRMHSTFLNHMQQFVYNAAGALRWRNDVNAYCEALRLWGLPLLDSRMGAVGALVGILVVEPDQLLPLINGTLRLDHREAIKYVRLRQDFQIARVQGRSLQQIFGSGDVVPGQPGPGPGQASAAAGSGFRAPGAGGAGGQSGETSSAAGLGFRPR
ncbi:hypothetical protein Vafri_9856 [Volvox africanus]|uniref:Exocyst complex component Sec10 n=1 Tax=Volvox africanus TaxID=51714 RepID=A0A8J4F2X2_9CHLO|nr:hypothetical protein Vafri_9856 [Volvox africanus]